MKNKGSSTFDELKRQLKNLEKDIQIKQYDYSSNETNKAISKTLDAEFTHRTHLFRTFGKGKKFQKANDWDYLVFKRRKQAVHNMMELADERFSAKYPEMCVADEIINLCLPGVALTKISAIFCCVKSLSSRISRILSFIFITKAII